PSEVIDTACSSSLIAVHRAIQSIYQDDCEMMIAGGSNLILTPKMHLLYSKAGMLSEDGACKTFSSEANGYVRGEGVAAILLKKLSVAKKDGDVIWGIVRGSAENHGGKANSLTAPNPKLQAKLIEEAMLNSQVDPRTIGYIECHGTGTELGDPIEIKGIQKAYKNLYRYHKLDTPQEPHCGLGSVKSNIGHLETTAGIAGVIKVLLSLKHKILPRTLNCSPLNSQINLEDSGFYIVNKNTEWKRPVVNGKPQPRRAGVSSFGAGGSNAHVILEEYIQSDTMETGTATSAPVIIVLSAETEAQLKQQAIELLEFVDFRSSKNNVDPKTGDEREINLTDMAYTLQIGRAAMEERLGLIVESLEQLTEKLKQYLEGMKEITALYQGNVVSNKQALSLFINDEDLKETLDKWLVNKKLAQLTEIWVKGINLDWSKLHREVHPRRMRLPTYPFAKQRYWIDNSTFLEKNQTKNQTNFIHPLVHQNVSSLNVQQYRTKFDGNEFFLDEHRVNQAKVLPAAAYLEMARAAVEDAVSYTREKYLISLNETMWISPILVQESKDIYVSLEPVGEDQVEFQISSEENQNETVHCRGIASFQSVSKNRILQLEKVRAQVNEQQIEAEQLYPLFLKMGLNYGPSHQSVRHLSIGQDEVLAHLEIPSINGVNEDDFVLHPSLIDGALQACNGLLINFANVPDKPLLPFALGSLKMLKTCDREMFAWIRYSTENNASSDMATLNIELCNKSGEVCVEMESFITRELPSGLINDSIQEVQESYVATPEWLSLPFDFESGDAISDFDDKHILFLGLEQVDLRKVENLYKDSRCKVLNLDPSDLAEKYNDAALSCFQRLKEIIQKKSKSKTLFQLVLADNLNNRLLTGLSGLLKTATLEKTDLKGQIVIVEKAISEEVLASQLMNAEQNSSESVIQYRNSEKLVLQWKKITNRLEEKSSAELTASISKQVFKEGGVYLITGGMGGLGKLFAKEILKQSNNAQIILTGRKSLSADKKEELRALSPESNQIVYQQLNIESQAEVDELVSFIEANYQGLNGIFHCAGMTADNFILKKTTSEFKSVLA
ncbi:MAG: SDR family NAD(P)-dependent oxidoreductase, partial [Kangiellaceae bacterium]|nr:SDR family NAD(P)-dependent oxidoreductase [Kangiellaceae bacterium]